MSPVTGAGAAKPVQNRVVGETVGTTPAIEGLMAVPDKMEPQFPTDVVPVGPRTGAVGEISTAGAPHTLVVGIGLMSPTTKMTIQLMSHVSPAAVAALTHRLLTVARSAGVPVSTGEMPKRPLTLVMLGVGVSFNIRRVRRVSRGS